MWMPRWRPIWSSIPIRILRAIPIPRSMVESDPDHVFVRLMIECEGYGLLGIGIGIEIGL